MMFELEAISRDGNDAVYNTRIVKWDGPVTIGTVPDTIIEWARTTWVPSFGTGAMTLNIGMVSPLTFDADTDPRYPGHGSLSSGWHVENITC